MTRVRGVMSLRIRSTEPSIKSGSGSNILIFIPCRFCRFSQGKDHLNFADWRIGLTKYEVPRKADGGKLDYIETVICRAGKPDQKLTKMSPAAVGLPTPTDDDVFIALLTLAKEQQFKSDKVHFVPLHLLNLLRWSPKPESYDRLEKSLERLTAVTLRFEYIWYDKITAEVEQNSSV